MGIEASGDPRLLLGENTKGFTEMEIAEKPDNDAGKTEQERDENEGKRNK